jgi:CubicO group peptidase (beta-lactamase class C family)
MASTPTLKRQAMPISKKYAQKAVVFTALFLGFIAPLAAQTNAPAPSLPPTPTQQKTDQQAWLSSLGAEINQYLQDWRVPGVAVAIVQDGQVIVAQGYGVRSIATPEPVNADTQFAIASLSKAFGAFGIALLVDEGKLAWDTPVRAVLPEFGLNDVLASDSVTIRDLLSHRTGVPRHDLAWFGQEPLNTRTLLARIRHLPATAQLRARYQYNNLMYGVIGALIERASGQSWPEFARKRIFEPLGMHSSNTTAALMNAHPNHATGHLLDRERDTIRAIALRNVDGIGPAASINSSVHDLALWMQMQLSAGLVNGSALVSALQMQQMHRPVSFEGVPGTGDGADAAYALGWRVDSYRGVRRITHGGNIDGFTARLTLYPTRNVGVVVLANMESSGLPENLARHISDRVLGLELRDWSTPALRLRQEDARLFKEARSANLSLGVHSKGKPSHPLSAYAGHYQHPGYGDFVIETNAGALRLRTGSLVLNLIHHAYDSFRMRVPQEDDAYEDVFITFESDFTGTINGFAANMDQRVPVAFFARASDARLSDPVFLQQLAGVYAYGQERFWRVTAQKNLLMLEVPGQQPQKLIPQGNAFVLESNLYARLEPVFDPKSNTVLGLRLWQAEGPYWLKRE